MTLRLSSILGSLLSLSLPGALLFGGTPSAKPAPSAELDRSPIDLAITPDGRWAISANNSSDTVSLVDLENGKVAGEVAVGHRPFGVAISQDGARAVVSNCWSNSLSVLTLNGAHVAVNATVQVGDEPRGVCISPDGGKAYVALAGDGNIVAVDLKTFSTGPRLAVGTEPWQLALTLDGSRLAVGNARSQEMSVVDTTGWKVLHSVKLRGKNVRHVAISSDGEYAYVPHIAERGRPATKDNIDMGWVIGNRLSRVPVKEDGPREAITLDPRGKAVADVDGLALGPDGKTIVLTAGGTHELLILKLPLPFITFGGPGDHIEKELLDDPGRFRRIALGGRPVGVRFLPDGKRVVVSNYLSNSIQVVDLDANAVTRTISLGGPPEPSLARRGETIFLDGERGFNHWYSCNSCHVEGHTNGSTFDTFNDGSYETPKKTLSLRNVTHTAPYTWHGWQPSLEQLVHDSMTKSMQGPEPSADDLKAVVAYLGTLKERPNPNRNADGSLSAAAKRGEAVFTAKKCDTCHAAPYYTAPGVFTVGLESERDVYKGFNPPSLLGVYNRAPYLHTGEVPGLTEVLTKFHRPSQLTGTPDCTAAELSDLIAFLKSL